MNSLLSCETVKVLIGAEEMWVNSITSQESGSGSMQWSARGQEVSLTKWQHCERAAQGAALEALGLQELSQTGWASRGTVDEMHIVDPGQFLRVHTCANLHIIAITAQSWWPVQRAFRIWDSIKQVWTLILKLNPSSLFLSICSASLVFSRPR